jgi:hypothetical protein
MSHEYLRVSHTSAQLDADAVSTALTSLYKLTHREPDRKISRLNPFQSEQPVTFEFVALSEGAAEPVEFYYGAEADSRS